MNNPQTVLLTVVTIIFGTLAAVLAIFTGNPQFHTLAVSIITMLVGLWAGIFAPSPGQAKMADNLTPLLMELVQLLKANQSKKE